VLGLCCNEAVARRVKKQIVAVDVAVTATTKATLHGLPEQIRFGKRPSPRRPAASLRLPRDWGCSGGVAKEAEPGIIAAPVSCDAKAARLMDADPTVASNGPNVRHPPEVTPPVPSPLDPLFDPLRRTRGARALGVPA
jgi:hypothetical protein